MAQQPTLERSMSPFSSFAISMSTICILAGGITSFHLGYCSVGGAAIGIGWPLEFAFALIVALALGQLASAFPTAGGCYHWSYALGGRALGWLTACLSLFGMITALAAVNTGLCYFVVSAMSRIGEYKPGEVYPMVQDVALFAMTIVQATINHRGIRLTSKLNDFSGYWIMAVAAILTVTLLACAFFQETIYDLVKLLLIPINLSGRPVVGKPVYDPIESMAWLFPLCLLLPAYTLTSFDSPAQTAEETVDAPRAVPRGIVRAVLVSGIAGWVLLCSLVLNVKNPEKVADAGSDAFFQIIRDCDLDDWTHPLIYIGLGVAMFLCGLAIVTSASRMTYAFARDGGVPGSRFLRRLSPRFRTPSIAIWAVSLTAMLLAFTPSYEVISSACAIFLYIAYALPTAAGLLAFGRTWTRMGPWTLGRWYRPVAVLCLLGCCALIFIGLRPPFQGARWVVGGAAALLFCVWFGYKRWHFPGPPPEVLAQLQLSEKPNPSHAAPTEALPAPVPELEKLS